MMIPSLRESISAIIYACIGYFLFCIVDTISKFLTHDFPAAQIMGVTGAAGLMLCTLLILIRHGWRGFMTPKWKLYLGRGFFQALATFLVIKALSTIPLADFYGIVFLVPLATTLLACVFLGEKIGIHRIGALLIGFAGVMVIAGPSFSGGNIGYAYVLGATFFSCAGGIFVRMIGHEPVRERYAFFPFAFGASFFLPMAVHDGMVMPENALQIGLFAAIPILVMTGLICYSVGFAKARDTAAIAPFHYTQMIWGIILGFVIFHDIPTLATLVGSAMIIAAGGIVIWREHLHHVHIATTGSENPL